MKRHLVTIAFVSFVGAILLTAVPVVNDSPDEVTSAPPRYLYSHYLDSDIQQYGLYELAELLGQYKWVSSHYQRGSFDCSEMSAFLEAMLEVQGWHTYIACGPSPWNPDKRHAWLLIETSPGFYVPVEATYPRIVSYSDRHFDEYFEYDHLFETIYDAFKYEPRQFDWWDSW